MGRKISVSSIELTLNNEDDVNAKIVIESTNISGNLKIDYSFKHSDFAIIKFGQKNKNQLSIYEEKLIFKLVDELENSCDFIALQEKIKSVVKRKYELGDIKIFHKTILKNTLDDFSTSYLLDLKFPNDITTFLDSNFSNEITTEAKRPKQIGIIFIDINILNFTFFDLPIKINFSNLNPPNREEILEHPSLKLINLLNKY